MEHLLEDEDFKTNVLRLTNRDRLETILVPILQSRTQTELVEFLTEKDILVAPVNDLEQIYSNEGLMNCIPVTKLPSGEITSGYDAFQNVSIGLPVMYNGNLTPEARYGPPAKGEHTHEILKELNFEDKKMNQLVSNGAVFVKEKSLS